MKSLTKKQKTNEKSLFPKNHFNNQPENLFTEHSIPHDDLRRFSEVPSQHGNPKQQNRYSRMTNIKSDHPSRQRSLTPGSQVSSIYMKECENRYKELQVIMKRQHENITQQNIFLQNQIRNLYERESKYKQSIKRYKQQIKFLKLQNEIYQQRYTEIKTYINSVIERMAQLTVIAEDEDKELFRTSSLEMVFKLKEELSHYEDYNEGEKQPEQDEVPGVSAFYKLQKGEHSKQVQSQVFVEDQHKDYARIQYDQCQDMTNNYGQADQGIQYLVDLQQTRFIKEGSKHSYSMKGDQQNAKKKLNKLPTFNRNSGESNQNSRQSQQSHRLNNQQNYSHPHLYKEASTPNSDSKTIDNHFKTKNFLQDTSESNCQPGITQQIEQLTDQSEALMYELQKTNNQDTDIKKKIIRISQKIRQLKMEANSIGDQHKFNSLQNINSKKI